MKTATSIKKMQHQREEDILNMRMANFVERWAPEGREEAGEFHAELHSIVRAVYADMQRPVTACLESVLMSSTMTPVVFKT